LAPLFKVDVLRYLLPRPLGRGSNWRYE